MLICVTGGVSSGKSKIAERIACALKSKETLYIATMINDCPESDKRVEKHKKEREGKGFFTYEKASDLASADFKEYEFCDTILLECMSNLLANEMFMVSDKFRIERIISGINNLLKHFENVIIVTNDLSGAITDSYSAETIEFIKNIGIINQYIGQKSDVFIESVVGIPNILKGKDIYEKYF